MKHDELLVARIINGDPSAFELLLDTYETPIYRLILGMVRVKEDAEDLTQDVFIKVYKRLDTFEGKSKLYSWIYRIALNHTRNFLARRRVLKWVSFDWLQEDQHVSFADDKPGLDEVVSAKISLEQLYQLLGNLSQQHRELILLYYVQDLRYEEIAEVLGLPIGTIKSRLSRAKAHLKRQFKGGKHAITV